MELRKVIIAIIGTSSASKEVVKAAELLGELLIDNGFRIISGGLSGVMEAVSKGGQRSDKHQDGDIIGILPGFHKSDANEFVDIVIPTGFGFARNLIIINSADVVVAIAGGSGTLSEIAFAWQFQKPIIGLDFKPEDALIDKMAALSKTDFMKSIGWSSLMSGLKLDETRTDKIYSARNPKEVLEKINEIIETTDLNRKIKMRYEK
jgi:uncharacterized protein (TIGR00725 family)